MYEKKNNRFYFSKQMIIFVAQKPNNQQLITLYHY